MDSYEYTMWYRFWNGSLGTSGNRSYRGIGTQELRQRVGKDLTSFMAFPERGNGGDNKWRGNCSPEVVRSVLRYVLDCKHYYGKQTQDFTLLDPMSGSGTSQAAHKASVSAQFYMTSIPHPPVALVDGMHSGTKWTIRQT